MKIKVKSIEPIPVWALSSIINGDDMGLEDEDIRLIQEWFETTGFDDIALPKDCNYHEYFTHYPAFGKPCDCVDCECLIFE